MLKVLVSAYACEPDRGSEPGVGWNWVKQITRFHKVWVITRANNRGPIEGGSAKEAIPNVQWVYFDLPYWMRFWKKGQRGIHLYYYLWQIGVYFLGKRLHSKVGFDLVQHVTFGNYWLPSFLALLPVPMVWGPLGGGESAPKTFYRTFNSRGKIYEWARDLTRAFGKRDPFVRLDVKRVAITLAKARETADQLRTLGANGVHVYSESGISREEILHLGDFPFRMESPFRLVSIGRFLHWKGFQLGLNAFAKFHAVSPRSEYWLIGDGPERRGLERQARRLGVMDKVQFCGRLPRQQVLEKLAACDVLLHPSLHDSGGWVCLEAMAAGRPVICLDIGGPALQVTEQTGIKVQAINPDQVTDELAKAMRQLAGNPDLRKRMGQAGRKRIQEHFEWNIKGECINKIYREIAGNHVDF